MPLLSAVLKFLRKSDCSTFMNASGEKYGGDGFRTIAIRYQLLKLFKQLLTLNARERNCFADKYALEVAPPIHPSLKTVQGDWNICPPSQNATPASAYTITSF